MKDALIKRKLLFNQFMRLVEENHGTITEAFMNDLLRNGETTAYRSSDRGAVYESSDRIYRDLSMWISREYSREKIMERYMKLGRERFEMGIPLPQVLKALVLQRRHLWLFVMDKLYDDATAYMDALQLNNRVTLYFDRAIVYTSMGYMNMIEKNI